MLNSAGLLGLLLLNLLSAWFVIAYELHHWHDEDHVFENLQALLLGAGVLLGSLLLRHSGREFLVWAALALLAFSLLLGSALIDRKLLPLEHPRLVEELLEIDAYLFMIWPALYRLLRLRQPTPVQTLA